MSVVPFCKNKRTGDISSVLLFCTIFLWYGNELSSIFLLISSLFVATAHEMRYISTTLCHFYFISSISVLLRETMPTRSPRLRLPHHTMSANRKKMPATMKPNIFTLSLFITPHHTLLLIPAHNPPPRSFTPAPHNPAHYLATITPYTSLLPPLLLATITPTTLLLLPLLLATPTPLPCNPSPTITHYAIPAPCNSHPLPHNPNSLHFTTRHLHTTALYLHLANPTPTPYSPQSQPFPCSHPCS